MRTCEVCIHNYTNPVNGPLWIHYIFTLTIKLTGNWLRRQKLFPKLRFKTEWENDTHALVYTPTHTQTRAHAQTHASVPSHRTSKHLHLTPGSSPPLPLSKGLMSCIVPTHRSLSSPCLLLPCISLIGRNPVINQCQLTESVKGDKEGALNLIGIHPRTFHWGPFCFIFSFF